METFLAPPTGRVGGKGRSETASEGSGGRMEGGGGGSSLSVRMGEAPHGHAWKCSADAQTD